MGNIATTVNRNINTKLNISEDNKKSTKEKERENRKNFLNIKPEKRDRIYSGSYYEENKNLNLELQYQKAQRKLSDSPSFPTAYNPEDLKKSETKKETDSTLSRNVLQREISLFGREINVPLKQFISNSKSNNKTNELKRENINDLNRDLNEYSPSKKVQADINSNLNLNLNQKDPENNFTQFDIQKQQMFKNEDDLLHDPSEILNKMILEAKSLINIKNFNEAIKKLTQVLEIDSHNIRALYHLAKCFLNIGNYELAYSNIKQAYKFNQDDQKVCDFKVRIKGILEEFRAQKENPQISSSSNHTNTYFNPDNKKIFIIPAFLTISAIVSFFVVKIISKK